jgi:hypothetical protein
VARQIQYEDDYSPNARLLRLEEAVRDFRRRWWLALAGYVLLAIGWIAAIYILTNQRMDLRDTQEGVVNLVRCAEHTNASGCEDLPTYKELLKELDD